MPQCKKIIRITPEFTSHNPFSSKTVGNTGLGLFGSLVVCYLVKDQMRVSQSNSPENCRL